MALETRGRATKYPVVSTSSLSLWPVASHCSSQSLSFLFCTRAEERVKWHQLEEVSRACEERNLGGPRTPPFSQEFCLSGFVRGPPCTVPSRPGVWAPVTRTFPPGGASNPACPGEPAWAASSSGGVTARARPGALRLPASTGALEPGLPGTGSGPPGLAWLCCSPAAGRGASVSLSVARGRHLPCWPGRAVGR